MPFKKPLAPPVGHIGSQKHWRAFLFFVPTCRDIKTSHHLWWWYLTADNPEKRIEKQPVSRRKKLNAMVNDGMKEKPLLGV
jgi:hypothetical protein